MRIGELAQRAGVTTRALRYYEQQGLISSARRHNGYRDYDAGALTRVDNIRLLLDIGLSTSDIARFGGCLDNELRTEPTCAAALDSVEQRMHTVSARIADLTDVRDRLRAHLAEHRDRPVT
ncbi:MAG: MerR family transcriptional regulator [Stackebrandtia sp.]